MTTKPSCSCSPSSQAGFSKCLFSTPELWLPSSVPGIQLGLTAWVRPYANAQAEILDFLEFGLLSVRFVLFSAISVLLIFFPTAATLWVWAVFLFVLLAAAVAYCGLHVMAQALRSVASELKEKEQREKEKKEKETEQKEDRNCGLLCESWSLVNPHVAPGRKDPQRGAATSRTESSAGPQQAFRRFSLVLFSACAGGLRAWLSGLPGALKQRAVKLLLPFFSPPELLAVKWSPRTNMPEIVEPDSLTPVRNVLAPGRSFRKVMFRLIKRIHQTPCSAGASLLPGS